MTETQKIDSADDLEIFGLVKTEYHFYANEVTNALNETLLLYDSVPDGMLGDIRDCFGHLCDAVIRTDQSLEKRKSNVYNAHKHLRRFILDCYKLQCIWYRQQLRSFDHKYRWSNLSDVHDGKFRPEYATLKGTAKKVFKEAQKAERPGNNDRAEDSANLEDVYVLYENSLKAYADALVYVEEALPAVERAAHKDIRRTVIAVIGWVIAFGATVVGIVLAS